MSSLGFRPDKPGTVVTLALTMFLLAMTAFWPMYLSRRWATVDGYTHAHALLGTTWLVALIVQPLLIARRERMLHRVIGRLAMFVAVGFVMSGVLLAHYRTSRMPEAMFATEGIYIYLPLSVALLFAVACALGFRWRRSTPVHARFMAATALLLLDPVLSRIMFFYLPPLPSAHLYQGISFSLTAGLLAVMLKSLPASAPGRGAFRNFCLGSVVTFALFFVVPYSSAWGHFARWFRTIALT